MVIHGIQDLQSTSSTTLAYLSLRDEVTGKIHLDIFIYYNTNGIDVTAAYNGLLSLFPSMFTNLTDEFLFISPYKGILLLR